MDVESKKNKPIIKFLYKSGGILGIIIVIWIVIFGPVVNVQFKNFSGPFGFGGSVWEALIEVNDGRPSGISNLNVKFTFPSEISKIEIISEGGFEGLSCQFDKHTQPKGFKYDHVLAYTGRIMADKCPSDSKATLRFRLKSSPCDEKPIHDEGIYESQFDWTIPIINVVIPWSSIDFWSKLSGVIPASGQETPFTESNTVQSPPYYDLKKREGDVIFYYEPEHFNKKLMTNSVFFTICRPSTKFKLYSKKEGSIGAAISWIYCMTPLMLKTKVEPVDVEKFKKEGFGVGVSVKWKNCEANLRISPTKRIKERDGSITLKLSPNILGRARCSGQRK